MLTDVGAAAMLDRTLRLSRRQVHLSDRRSCTVLSEPAAPQPQLADGPTVDPLPGVLWGLSGDVRAGAVALLADVAIVPTHRTDVAAGEAPELARLAARTPTLGAVRWPTPGLELARRQGRLWWRDRPGDGGPNGAWLTRVSGLLVLHAPPTVLEELAVAAAGVATDPVTASLPLAARLGAAAMERRRALSTARHPGLAALRQAMWAPASERPPSAVG